MPRRQKKKPRQKPKPMVSKSANLPKPSPPPAAAAAPTGTELFPDLKTIESEKLPPGLRAAEEAEAAADIDEIKSSVLNYAMPDLAREMIEENMRRESMRMHDRLLHRTRDYGYSSRLGVIGHLSPGYSSPIETVRAKDLTVRVQKSNLIVRGCCGIEYQISLDDFEMLKDKAKEAINRDREQRKLEIEINRRVEQRATEEVARVLAEMGIERNTV